MTRINRLILLAVTAFLVIGVVAPAMATEESTGDNSTETTVAPEPVFEGEGPAVVVPPAKEAEVEQPWTVRFIYPVLVLVTILLIIGLAFGYNRSIRTRYRVVG